VPNILDITVPNPDELLNAGAYGAGAVIRVQTSATQAGAYADVSGTGSTPTLAIVTGVLIYYGYDPSGTSTSWYRTRYENVGATRTSAWTTVFQPNNPGQVSRSDVKTYLGLTGTGDDELIDTCINSATSQAERDTGRTFTYTSNVIRDYSTDGQVTVQIADTPKTDSTRVVTLGGVTLTEGTGYWLLPDRRNPDVSVTIQLFMFDRNRTDWYKSDPQWWDKNLDVWWGRYGNSPLDLRITGYIGHPTWKADVFEQVRFLAAWFYWRAKSGASGVIQTPTGEEIDLGTEPSSSPVFVGNWRVRTAVASV
jgi:hypothetical protein